MILNDPKFLAAQKILKDIQSSTDYLLVNEFDVELVEFERRAVEVLQPLHQVMLKRLKKGSKLTYCTSKIRKNWDANYPLELSGRMNINHELQGQGCLQRVFYTCLFLLKQLELVIGSFVPR